MAYTKKAIYYPRHDADVASYYDNVVKKLSALADKYGVSAELLEKLNEYNTGIPEAKLKSDEAQQRVKALVKAKSDLFFKAKTELLREMKRVTDLDNFDEADAMDFGIRKEKTPANPREAKPVIPGITVLPEKVLIEWVKGTMDGVLVYASLNGTDFEEIGTDMRSPFEDTRPNQVAGVIEMRYYRLRYIKNDELTGLYSDVVNVRVLI
ncbi:MAG: hypothetical protein WBP45_10910 [Daejeonella sp.]